MSSFPLIRRISEECLKLDAFQAALPSKQPDCPEELKWISLHYCIVYYVKALLNCEIMFLWWCANRLDVSIISVDRVVLAYIDVILAQK